MYNNGTLRGSWSSVNGAYTNFSDRRLKKDISELPVGVLSKLNGLKSYSFRYNDNKSTDQLTIGFMAQDVQPLFPEAVTEITNKDGSTSLGLKYQYYGVYAVKAIQEQQQIIDKQQKTIDDLLKRVEKLEQK
ncbi:MAG: tail fiber domain-containing protein [Chitinophagaceae bacterium]|nr:tail fiber domain-containing protein [Chitinophagaceae bacterium]